MAKNTVKVVFGPAKYEKSQVTITSSGDAIPTGSGQIKSVCVDHGGTFNDIPSDMVRGLRDYMKSNAKLHFALPDDAPQRLIQYLSRGIHLVTDNDDASSYVDDIDDDVETEPVDEEETIDDGAQ